MNLTRIEEYKSKMTAKGHIEFLNQSDNIRAENKRYSTKEVEETAIKSMLNSKDKLLLFKNDNKTII